MSHSGRTIVTSVITVFVTSAILRTVVYNWLVDQELLAGQLAGVLVTLLLGFFAYHRRNWARWIIVAFSVMVGALSLMAVASSDVAGESAVWMVMFALSGYIVVALIFPHSVNEFFKNHSELESSRE
ncbi:MAG: hypothetical protein ACE1ZA_15940 [Pseudomonadales bacterium]